MTPERFARIQATIAHRQPDLTVITDEVYKGHNLSAIVRSCDAVGIHHVHIVTPQGYKPHTGTTMGSHLWVKRIQYQDVESPIKRLQNIGFQVVTAHKSTQSVDYRSIDYCKPTALLMGTERQGVSDKALELADVQVEIPMVGMVESFNVSVAAAIILIEAQRQRKEVGMYDKPRLPQALIRDLTFRWSHPKLARMCDEKGLAYPAIDDQGILIEPSLWYRNVREGVAEMRSVDSEALLFEQRW